MNVLKLANVLQLEKAATDCFAALNASERAVYLTANPKTLMVTAETAFLDHLKKGALHKQMGVPKGEKIPVSDLKSEEKDAGPKEKKRIQFALNARKWHHK